MGTLCFSQALFDACYEHSRHSSWATARAAAANVQHSSGRTRQFYGQRDKQDWAQVGTTQAKQQAIEITRPRRRDLAQCRSAALGLQTDLHEDLPPVLGSERRSNRRQPTLSSTPRTPCRTAAAIVARLGRTGSSNVRHPGGDGHRDRPAQGDTGSLLPGVLLRQERKGLGLRPDHRVPDRAAPRWRSAKWIASPERARPHS